VGNALLGGATGFYELVLPFTVNRRYGVFTPYRHSIGLLPFHSLLRRGKVRNRSRCQGGGGEEPHHEHQLLSPFLTKG
jgi:hypothetical protein